MNEIIPVLLSGGTGSRLWPLSRETYPKQLLPLLGPETLLQETMRRVSPSTAFGPAFVIANSEHRFVIAEQLRAIDRADVQIVLEPVGRNTCPAAVVAAILAMRHRPDSLVLLMPADHQVADSGAFLKAVETGVPAAQAGHFVLFGIPPLGPATGYGYIRSAKTGEAVRPVMGFTEKPDRKTAEAYLAAGGYSWNSGIFLLPARAFLAEVERLDPAMLSACQRSVETAQVDLDFLRLDAESFASAPNISIDYAVMEKTANAVVVDADCGWSDIGTWSALWDAAHRDASGMVEIGDVMSIDSTGSYLRSDGPLVAAIGVEDLIVVATADAVLVTRKDRDQDVKTLVEQLRAKDHPTATQTQRVHRPWGFFQSLHIGERFQVKRITVLPGAKLSLQKHFHRAEHWVVVNGTALVTRDGEEILVQENESVYLPLGCVHRLANPGRVVLNLIEVQSGAYLGEDDIVRLDDLYSRV
ncbi:mannose-1-phosphate guanylyltransferase/mannose-6-phosphate isomerase [Microvirga antarctica]|uniref:mannose-1-phosphate guanylyltransferase/mannose-6-phosphate isomerase n=1 Tax=Microvirga antarctica TaxID=2819233 RepID=UPI001B30170C|nr:mannose-1-phosphate guanylyltransferase/mannose-6-phosphate isomerase [Microvirga antarctica]